MGCFNSSGFISKLPIRCGDRVVCFIATFSGEGRGLYEPDSLVAPFFLPIRGSYDDYGSVENVDRTHIVEMIEKCAGGTPIKEILNGVERCCYGETIEDNLRYWQDSKKNFKAEDGFYDDEIKLYEKTLKLFVDGRSEQTKKSMDEFMEKYCPGEYDKYKETHNEVFEHTAVLLLEHEEIYDRITEEFAPNKSTYFKSDEERYNAFMSFIDITKDYCEKHGYEDRVVPSPTGMYFMTFEMINYLRKISNEKTVEGIVGMMDDNAHLLRNSKSLEMFDKLSDKDKLDTYTIDEKEMRRFFILYMVFAQMPMYFTFSQTAGMQEFRYDLIERVYDACMMKLKKDSEEYKEDCEDGY